MKRGNSAYSPFLEQRNMYWIYLAFFVLAILTPLLVTHGYGLLPEEDLEGLIIMLLGMISFFIYLAKERALFRLVRERLSLQKTTNIIQRDLSESYSYIGAMNRKQEIMKELLFELAEGTARDGDHCDLWYRKILETARVLSKSEDASIRFVQVAKQELLDHYEGGERGNRFFIGFSPAVLTNQEKTSFEYQGCCVVRSPRISNGIAAFLIVKKQVNHFEDEEIFKMLASEALLLYTLSCQNINTSSYSYADRH